MALISVFYTLIPDQIPEIQFEKALQKLPPDQQIKIRRYFRKMDAYASLLGKLLLIKQLKNTSFLLSDLKYNPQDRPYFLGDLDFNISHSDKYVICAVSETGKLGIDIEKINPIELKYFREQWTKSELQQIENQGINTFYHFWTRKEAIIKADGKGLTIPLTDFSVEKETVILENQTWFLYPISVPSGYVSHLAFEEKIDISEILIKKINWELLFD